MKIRASEGLTFDDVLLVPIYGRTGELVACFSVEDTGRGIVADDLPFVFDRYWQAKETAHLGTGLGLAIAKGIVVAHGGSISVDSQIGRGTKFSFTIPLARSPRVDG